MSFSCFAERSFSHYFDYRIISGLRCGRHDYAVFSDKLV